MQQHRIITVGRQLGSGGCEIGEKLAAKLDLIPPAMTKRL